MAKTPKPKKKTASLNSRAARRATSPTMIIKDLPTSAGGTAEPYIPRTDGSSGIRKSKTRKTRAQKLRQQKVVERADLVSARTQMKIAKSVGKRKVVKERRKDWEAVNGVKRKSGFEVLKDGGDDDDEGWDDEEEEVGGGVEDRVMKDLEHGEKMTLEVRPSVAVGGVENEQDGQVVEEVDDEI
ncbi:hypothetical protein BT63DRAFT_442069 [Microthyrium microscopicum]|uniref:Ribosome biogenesis protein Alb1 n=1 Tax=Microthyrium microscopicum TaxID=703497 RepID=A0A6A6U7I9_9PEZI|nr:hypothetical protein BT63DRAFT_442069 [Microthyrium microscopicum]